MGKKLRKKSGWDVRKDPGLFRWNWWRDHVLAGVVTAGMLALISALWAFTVGPCQQEKPQPESVFAPRLSAAVAETTKNESLGASLPAPVSWRAAPKTKSEAMPATAPWEPPPYAHLRIRDPRTHPLEFKLYGDSIVVDGLFEQGARSIEQWPDGAATTPTLSVQSYDYHGRLAAHRTYTGQWVTFERDRAVFVVPRDTLLSWNLRVAPGVRHGAEAKRPRVVGKWTVKKVPGVWDFRLEVDRSGKVVKRGWYDARGGALAG